MVREKFLKYITFKSLIVVQKVCSKKIVRPEPVEGYRFSYGSTSSLRTENRISILFKPVPKVFYINIYVIQRIKNGN